jgi:NAD-dependent SIR2 family protein deacetylase
MDNAGIRHAANLIASADALVVAAGAGMSVDSGLPDFRGSRGLWTTLLGGGITEDGLHEFMQGRCFATSPRKAWRFYGEAIQRCRNAAPHPGYRLLLNWAHQKQHGAFVYTSNVDGQFHAAGFPQERIVECHGSIHHLQCARPCSPQIWPAPDAEMTARALHSGGMPRCAHCGGVARPNVLLFSDPAWVAHRTNAQRLRMEVWQARPANPVVIEIGAGLTLPAVRMFSESLRMPLIRVNAHEAHADDAATVALQGTALDVLRRIDRELADVPCLSA